MARVQIEVTIDVETKTSEQIEKLKRDLRSVERVSVHEISQEREVPNILLLGRFRPRRLLREGPDGNWYEEPLAGSG